MRTLSGLFVANLVLLAGCGGGTKTVTNTVTTEASLPPTASTESTATTSTTTASGPSCESLAQAAKQGVGSCERSGGASAKYAAVGHHLVLSGLSARYVSKSTAPALTGEGGGGTAKAHGIFVIVSVELTNREHSSQEWNHGQASLLVNGSSYDDSFDAENGPDQKSFVWKIGGIGGKLQSGESQTGDIIFDIPHSALSALEREGGAVAIRDFGEEKQEGAYGGVLLLPKG